MSLQIINANDRVNETHSIMGCIVGKSGIGKTSQLLTLSPATTLFCDLERGNLSVRSWRGDMIKLETWDDCVDIATILGGPNHDRRPKQTFSSARYAEVCSRIDKSAFDKYDTIFIDGVTAVVGACFQWCMSQSNDRSGNCDTRGAYGLLVQEMRAWLQQLRVRCKKHIWFTGLLDDKPDEFGKRVPSVSVDGNKVSLEFPAMLDVIVTMTEVRNASNKPVRAFICDTVNEWNYPAKDRSMRLSSMEEPNLGKLMQKILAQKTTAASNAAGDESKLDPITTDSNLTTLINTTTTNTNQPTTINQ